ncbi:MAG: 30S ribosomal protein S21 [Alphaproteobacteria bacterium]|nr:30S ribosomal protein S21 [Alphaproteobacteria bacterium]
MVKIVVRNDNVEKAMRVMKKIVAKEGITGEIKKRAYFEKKTEARKRKAKEAVRRERKRQFKERIFFGS